MGRKGSVHQIWHGDSRVECARFKPGTVDCIVTDPPFGVDNQSNMAVTKQGKEMARKIAGDATPEEAIQLFREVMDVLLPKTAPDADMYVFTAHQVLELWLALLKGPWAQGHGFRYKGTLVWEKDGPGMGDLDSWGMAHEFCILVRKGENKNREKRRSGVIHVPQLRPNQLIHPHEKPEQLLTMLIKQSTDPGAFLVDPFGGSGSLVRAARSCGRGAVAIEYDEKNYNLAKGKLEAGGGMDLFS